jgi:catechol 2,3-dioxygenase-like lactoylglutathione lyase family enzyme
VTIQLNHLIVPATDQKASARFLADILGIDVGLSWGPFLPVQVGTVTLDYEQVTDFRPLHLAFLVSEAEFDDAHRRMLDSHVATYADPFRRQPGEINHLYGGRGVYFDDPDGHYFELITRPYDTTPEGGPTSAN